MLCTRCNKHFSDEYVVCPECGDVLRKETDQFQEQLQYNNPHGESPIPDKSILYIVLSILSFFCCNQITGVIAAVFSLLKLTNNDVARHAPNVVTIKPIAEIFANS